MPQRRQTERGASGVRSESRADGGPKIQIALRLLSTTGRLRTLVGVDARLPVHRHEDGLPGLGRRSINPGSVGAFHDDRDDARASMASRDTPVPLARVQRRGKRADFEEGFGHVDAASRRQRPPPGRGRVLKLRSTSEGVPRAVGLRAVHGGPDLPARDAEPPAPEIERSIELSFEQRRGHPPLPLRRLPLVVAAT